MVGSARGVAIRTVDGTNDAPLLKLSRAVLSVFKHVDLRPSCTRLLAWTLTIW